MAVSPGAAVASLIRNLGASVAARGAPRFLFDLAIILLLVGTDFIVFREIYAYVCHEGILIFIKIG